MKECCGPKEEKKYTETISHSDLEAGGTVSVFHVSGMDCADEIAAVNSALRIEGVSKVDANLMKETVSVVHDERLARTEIAKLIRSAGLKVKDGDTEIGFVGTHRNRILLIASSGALLSAGLVLEWTGSKDVLALICLGLSIIFAGVLIVPKALRAVRTLHLDMNVLMVIAVVGAVAIKEYSEAASVVFLFALAELLEAMSVERARRAIRDVLKVAPKEAFVILPSGKTEKVNAESVKVGDTILIRPGDSVPLDGEIVEGQSSLNQSSLTGESRPEEKGVGAQVFAGTINESASLKVKVGKLYQDTKISKVIAMIEDAQKERAPSQRFVDRFAKIYTPVVMLLALGIAVVPPVFFAAESGPWIYKALVFLVIGCPCALVIATPVSVVSGLTSLARRGVLVKGGNHLESLGKLKAVAMDKTGTITEGKPAVLDMTLFGSLDEKQVIAIAASIEGQSSHPLAQAVLRFAEARNIDSPHPTNFRMVVGKGAVAEVDGHPYFAGNHALAHELGVCTPAVEAYLTQVEDRAMSVIVVGHKPHSDCKGEILAVFAVGDRIRKGVERAIQEFHKAGVIKVVMLSGDNQKTVDAVAKAVGIDHARGGLLPEDKVQAVKELVQNHQFVGMVGDGVNDAPALANATIGIAMGVVGSDTAIETADVALMKDDVFMLPKAIRHGRKVLNVIRFNIAFAIAVKAVFFVLAFFDLTNLWLAVASDMGASLIVTFNALRLLRSKGEEV